MDDFRNTLVARFVCGILALYLLNISVDTADPQPSHLPEDLSFNDQESIVEILVEQVLGFEDAIKEYDDCDTEEHNKKKNVKIELVYATYALNQGYTQHFDSKKHFLPQEARLLKGFQKIDSPPPKA